MNFWLTWVEFMNGWENSAFLMETVRGVQFSRSYVWTMDEGSIMLRATQFPELSLNWAYTGMLTIFLLNF